MPRTGCVPELIVTEGTTSSSFNDLAVQAGVLYYAVGNQVKSVPADATNATGTVVASAAGSGRVLTLAVDGALLFWSAAAPQPEPLGPYNIEDDLISGGSRRTFGTAQGSNSLTTDGAHVYWADGATLQSQGLRRFHGARDHRKRAWTSNHGLCSQRHHRVLRIERRQAGEGHLRRKAPGYCAPAKHPVAGHRQRRHLLGKL